VKANRPAPLISKADRTIRFEKAGGTSVQFGPIDFSFGISRYDTENSRQNNGYRSVELLGDVGFFFPVKALRIGLVYYYNYAELACQIPTSPSNSTEPIAIVFAVSFPCHID